MSRILELPDDLADALTEEASRLGLTLPDYAVRLLSAARPAKGTGAELVAYWQSEGLIGTRSDATDSPTLAREIRNQAEHRGE